MSGGKDSPSVCVADKQGGTATGPGNQVIYLISCIWKYRPCSAIHIAGQGFYCISPCHAAMQTSCLHVRMHRHMAGQAISNMKHVVRKCEISLGGLR